MIWGKCNGFSMEYPPPKAYLWTKAVLQSHRHWNTQVPARASREGDGGADSRSVESATCASRPCRSRSASDGGARLSGHLSRRIDLFVSMAADDTDGPHPSRGQIRY